MLERMGGLMPSPVQLNHGILRAMGLEVVVYHMPPVMAMSM